MRSGRGTLLQINDVHGYLEPHPELFWDGGRSRFETLGGYARIAGLFARIRQETGGAVLACDNGDTFHGTYPVVQSKGRCLLPILNHLGLDAMTTHRDFAYGPPHLRDLVARLGYPLLAINCYDLATDQLTFPPSIVIERGGLRIGVVGIAATIVDKTMPPKFSMGIRLTLGRDELPGHIRRLRHEEDVDLVIVLSHLGFPQDVQLATDVPGIDVVLSGHTHNRIHVPAIVNGATIIQSGCHGSFVGRLDVEVRDNRVTEVKHRLIAVDATIEPDPGMARLVDEAMAPHRAMLDTIVGEVDLALDRNSMFETTMDNLLLDAVAHAAGLEIAFSNGWRYGAPIVPGPVTMNDLYDIIPSDPPVSTIDLTGQEIRDMLEENLERTFAANPYDQMGGFVKRCRGLDVYVKVENPRGQRIQDIFVGGWRLDPAAFVTAQGVPARYGRNREDLDVSAVEALRRHLAAGHGRRPELTGTVTAV